MLIIFILGNMFISMMVQIKFDRHILYIIGVYWMVSKVYNVLYSLFVGLFHIGNWNF